MKASEPEASTCAGLARKRWFAYQGIRATLLEDAGRSQGPERHAANAEWVSSQDEGMPDVAMWHGPGDPRDGPVNPATGTSPASGHPIRFHQRHGRTIHD